ncbi:major facilitator superfamily domain-containing protein [Hirsutella rhossiliensis]|uniref:Major facilitator superfamily domain-containing protein n=1 Tax=Hirsutella rhossiliensis TaxID=111463 RepID=A0A9P8MR90_9HYPO|nr:major facilitator superfamily domain-containing protein [Hirsutella rhossiliensis]KAH0960368.1 major facilitator superfamily domain-containing protein [Hirsutella rhossiliensis]
MRWLGTASVDKEYRSLVVHLDKKEEVDRDFNQRDATVATSTDTCIIAARRQLRSVDSAPNRAILRRLAPRTFLSVQRAVEKEHTRLQILGARYIAGNSPSYVWIGSAYLLGNATFVPAWGKISDIFGRKLVLISAVVIFWIGSLLCAVSNSIGMLIAARAVQGVGGGGTIVF